MQKPNIEDFGLNNIVLYTYEQNKKRFTLISLIISITIFGIIIFFISKISPDGVLGGICMSLSIGLVPFVLLMLFFENIVLPHIFGSKNLRAYFNTLKQYENYIKEKHERELKENKEYWFSLSGHRFEEEMTKVFTANGYKATKTKGSNDGGIDIILYEGKNLTLVQCKAYKKQLSPATARELFGVMTSRQVKQGMIICLGGFSKETIKFAYGKNIELLDINDIIRLSNKASNKIDIQMVKKEDSIESSEKDVPLDIAKEIKKLNEREFNNYMRRGKNKQ